MGGDSHPPPWLARLLAQRLGSSEVGRTILGDLHEEFAERAAADRPAALRWYRREALSVLCRPSAVAVRTFNRQLAPPGDSVMTRLWIDLRHAVRALAGQPRFSLVASMTLALGVGATTAIFSVVNGILLKPLPYEHGDRLVNVWSHAPKLGYDQFPLSPDLYFLYERDNEVFEAMATLQTRRVSLSAGGSPDVVSAVATTHTYFETFGISMAQGRAFAAEEDAPGASAVAVISHRAWRDRFGLDPGIVGRRIRVNDIDTEVVGVTPAAIDGSGTADVFIPAALDRADPIQGAFGWNAVARLRDGVTTDAAARQLALLVPRLAESTTSANYRAFLADGDYAPRVNPMKADIIGSIERPLWLLLGTVGMLLLIACANVANLFLVRAEGRQLEMAIRVAMGSARGTLVRGLMAEALVLAGVGSAVGLAAVAVGLPVLLRMAPPTLPRLHLVALDVPVMLFAVGITVVAAVLSGLLPALKYTTPRSLEVLRHGTRGTDEPARQRARYALVIAQTALAVVLLVGSGLLARSFSRLIATDPGFTPDQVMTFRTSLPATQYPDGAPVRSFHDRLMTRLAAVPGVAHVGGTSVLPIVNASPGTAHIFEDLPPAAGSLPPIVHYKMVAGDYFGAMRIPLLRGRSFHSGDLIDSTATAVVNQALVDEFFPGQDGVGKRFRQGGQDTGDGLPPWITIIGVVGTERHDGLRMPERPFIYYANPAIAPAGLRTLDYAVQGPGITARGDELRRAVWAEDAGLPIAALRPMQQILDESMVAFTFTMVTIGLAAALALVLGAIGLYGVLSYAVTLRTREIGVRLALGAQPGAVLRSVVVHGSVLAAIGLVIGLAGAAGLTRLMQGLLFETEPLDPVTFATMSGMLLVVAALSSYLPARRAALVSPMESMKSN